jgi:2-oxoglutarate dehydrogenase E1 component
LALIRIEQLYPIPTKQLEDLYKIQQGHLVLGAGRATEYGCSLFFCKQISGINYGVISPPSASTATGFAGACAGAKESLTLF